MLAPPVPVAREALLPLSIRAAGGVRLRFGCSGGRTQRREVAESGGYRVRFPTSYDQSCEAVLINTGGGMAGGDAMRVEAALEAGCDAVITSQAAEKIYRSQGADTEVATRLSVASGARLAWLPQETILFSGARLNRSLTIEMSGDAELVACETMFFGRSAMGESVQRGALHDRWRLRRDGRLLLAEDLRIDGAIADQLARPAIGAGACAAATVLASGGQRSRDIDSIRLLLRESGGDSVESGAGLLSDLLVVRLLSRDAQALRRVLVTLLGQVTGRALPRTWSI
ncbi:hypothetical protein ASG72_17310 [Bosea sp. Leaf344]|uniref:urease accessory protein UreD n=1 Tax=Bosea sp. Leaf344 TaxID=1736346 RepID=UPI0007023029|nr:urease accessory protein UreD [Bosea sp. Leaf344]KQU50376.1 hypothetical protein ASG72_17310 [Bosea sp. Leaf344]